MKKGISIVIIILAVLILAVGCFAADTKTPMHADGTYINSEFKYSISVPSSFSMVEAEDGGSSDPENIMFVHKDNSFSAAIVSEKIDTVTFETMRKYLNDYSSGDEDIFQKIYQYKSSYLNALESYYTNNYLLGAEGENLNETNMKVFRRYSEKIFGVDSEVALYSIIKSDKLHSNEEINIWISIPVFSNKTIYTVSFLANKGALTETASDAMSRLLNSIQIEGLPKQTEPLGVFTDKEALKAANSGVYPNLWGTELVYTDLINSKSGYKISYPSIFIPYSQNSIVDSIDYNSFKINYNNQFSILAEPVPVSGENSEEIMESVRKISVQGKNTIEEGSLEISGKKWRFIKYESKDEHTETSYVYKFFTANNSTIYTLKLESRLEKPSSKIETEFVKIVNSLEFTEKSDGEENPGRIDGNSPDVFREFVNSEEGFSLRYPETWALSQKNTDDINFDIYTLKSPEYSSALDIYIAGGELNGVLDSGRLSKFEAASGRLKLNYIYKKYYPPYLKKKFTLLSTRYLEKDGLKYLYRLVNYIDDSGRLRYCYSVDIIRDRKVFTLFITASEYITKNGSIIPGDLSSKVNEIARSYSALDTTEYSQWYQKGETRNKKIVFIEDFFKKNLGEAALVSSAVYSGSPKDVLVMVEGIEESGIYRINFDYSSKGISIIDRTLKTDIMEQAVSKLKSIYKGKIIDRLSTYDSYMSIEIEYRNTNLSQPDSRTYKVDMDISDGRLNWTLIREVYKSSLRKDFTVFMRKYLSKDAMVYFLSPKEFEAMGQYRKADKKYTTAVYVESGKRSGYYILQFDPVYRSIDVLSYTSPEDLHDKIRQLFENNDKIYQIFDLEVSDTDKFQINIQLHSSEDEAPIPSSVRVKFNHEFDVLEITK